jgi:hypothetical protein
MYSHIFMTDSTGNNHVHRMEELRNWTGYRAMKSLIQLDCKRTEKCQEREKYFKSIHYTSFIPSLYDESTHNYLNGMACR